MRAWGDALLAALRFLTTLPLPHRFGESALGQTPTLLAFPWAGLVLGVMLSLLATLLSFLPDMVLAGLLLIFWVLITGNLHLDGLADCADAWVGGQGDSGRALEIMKDPRAGPAAVSAVVLYLLFMFACLFSLLQSGEAWAALLAAPVVGRGAALALFTTTPYLREQGLGSLFLQGLTPERAWRSLTLAALLLVLVTSFAALAWLTVAVVMFMALRTLSMRRFGGMTGDVAGACIVLMEATVLFAAVLF